VAEPGVALTYWARKAALPVPSAAVMDAHNEGNPPPRLHVGARLLAQTSWGPSRSGLDHRGQPLRLLRILRILRMEVA